MDTFHRPPAFDEAFRRLRDSVSTSDAIAFNSTSLEDVWKCAREIQEVQRKKRSLQNLRRIEPLLQGLEKYSKSIDVICNGTPYIPWVWAPIKLMLQLATEHSSIFEKLISAYADIAEVLPSFDRLQKTFPDDSNFRIALSLVYTDILEFHQQAYSFFRRGGWHIIFDSFWKDFGSRFSSILESLARHKHLIESEARTIDIVEAKTWRTQALEDLKLREKERRSRQLQDGIQWLGRGDSSQEDQLESLSRRRQAGTCEWVLKKTQLNTWLDDGVGAPMLWLKGIPGAGKSVLSSHIIQILAKTQKAAVAYYFCDSHSRKESLCIDLFRSLALQLLRANIHLAPYIADKYIEEGRTASMVELRDLLSQLPCIIGPIRLVIDGLDECKLSDQRLILPELLALIKGTKQKIKILISSREGIYLSKRLLSASKISLTDNKSYMERDIRSYVHDELRDLRHRYGLESIRDIEQTVVKKAKGMFLWVRLVINELQDRHSISELRTAAHDLPNGLDEAYGRIFERIAYEYGDHSKNKAIRILEWMAYSFRPLKVFEILHGVLLYPGTTVLSNSTRLPHDILDLCRPLIDVRPDNTICFVHFSAKEYMLHVKSGPFLRPGQAHFDISFSCVTYLLTSTVLRSQVSIRDRMSQMVNGYHGLLLYAHDFWIEHVLQLASSYSATKPTFPQSLVEQLRKLETSMKRPCSHSVTSMNDDEKQVLELIRGRISKLEGVPELHRMVADILILRARSYKEQAIGKTPPEIVEIELKYDTTSFSDIYQNYQDGLEALFTSEDETLAYLPPDLLYNFRREYDCGVFICRYRGCPRGTAGFQAPEERERHHQTHVKRYRCSDKECEFYPVGFGSKSAVDRHNAKYHEVECVQGIRSMPRQKTNGSKGSLFSLSPYDLPVRTRVSKAISAAKSKVAIEKRPSDAAIPLDPKDVTQALRKPVDMRTDSKDSKSLRESVPLQITSLQSQIIVDKIPSAKLSHVLSESQDIHREYVQHVPDYISFPHDRDISLEIENHPLFQFPYQNQHHTGQDMPPAIVDAPIERFEPYQSAFKGFPFYKFLPGFLENVPGGYESITYSHNLDHEKYLQLELLKSMAQDAILTDIAHPDRIRKRYRVAYCAGLKEVLTLVRTEKCRGFNVVAERIMQFHQAFRAENGCETYFESLAWYETIPPTPLHLALVLNPSDYYEEGFKGPQKLQQANSIFSDSEPQCLQYMTLLPEKRGICQPVHTERFTTSSINRDPDRNQHRILVDEASFALPPGPFSRLEWKEPAPIQQKQTDDVSGGGKQIGPLRGSPDGSGHPSRGLLPGGRTPRRPEDYEKYMDMISPPAQSSIHIGSSHSNNQRLADVQNSEAPDFAYYDSRSGRYISEGHLPRRGTDLDDYNDSDQIKPVRTTVDQTFEKERRLQMMMEALRKSRFERAQKAARSRSLQDPALLPTDPEIPRERGPIPRQVVTTQSEYNVQAEYRAYRDLQDSRRLNPPLEQEYIQSRAPEHRPPSQLKAAPIERFAWEPSVRPEIPPFSRELPAYDWSQDFGRRDMRRRDRTPPRRDGDWDNSAPNHERARARSRSPLSTRKTRILIDRNEVAWYDCGVRARREFSIQSPASRDLRLWIDRHDQRDKFRGLMAPVERQTLSDLESNPNVHCVFDRAAILIHPEDYYSTVGH